MNPLAQLQNGIDIIAYTPDEFIASFSVGDLYNYNLIQSLKGLEVPANRIGQASGVGAVYVVPNSDMVLKISNICPQNQQLSPSLNALCQMAVNGDLMYRVPNTPSGKMSLYAPNYVLEAIIAAILNSYKKYTPCFTKILGIQYDFHSPEKKVYILQEKLLEIAPLIKSSRSFIQISIQLLHALDVAQKKGKYVHYDLHAGNVMARKLPKGTISIYELGNGKYMYTYTDFDAVIIDYGHNRLETDDSILTPKLIFNLQAGGSGQREMVDMYEFNPYYDVFSFLSNFFMRATSNQPAFPWNNRAEIDSIFAHFFEVFFNPVSNLPNNTEFLSNLYEHIRDGGGWRPLPERLATEWIDNEIPRPRGMSPNPTGQKFIKASTPGEMLDRISTHFKKAFFPQYNGSYSDHNQVFAYLDTYGVFFSDQVLKFEGYDNRFFHQPSKKMETVYYNYLQRDVGVIDDRVIDIRYFNYANRSSVLKQRLSYEPYNRTRAKDVSGQDMDPNNQHVHVALIDIEKGRRNGYKFRFDCCRIDIRNYLQTKKIAGGIAINASFFQIKNETKNFLPIGMYRTNTFTSNEDIPKIFEPYYGIVGMDRNGNMNIDVLANFGKYNQLLTSGPLLVLNRKGMFDKNIMSNPIFQCGPGAHDCQKIDPGEFWHIANPNPRTALGILGNGNVVFVHVEGRGNRGAGMDILQLQNTMLNLGCVNAINLDGGRSSQLMWRSPGEEVIRQAGPTISTAYPVGNIISYVKN